MNYIKENILQHFILTSLLLTLIISPNISESARVSPRPDPDNAPAFARWLVSQGSWGVLNTLDTEGAPFGNVASYSDGGKGTPYFYLSTTRDPTGYYALINQTSSFTLSEETIGTCNGATDPQSPICAKITIMGMLELLVQKSKEAAFARAALFRAHPRLAGWPKNNGFQVFKLEIKNIFLVNSFAPAKNVTADQYNHSKA